MAIVNRKQAEREYYARKLNISSSSSQTPLNELRRRYFAQVLTGVTSKNVSLADLERQFFANFIRTQGATPSTTRYLGTLVKEAVASLGITPTQYLDDNYILFFLGAP